MTYYRIDNRTFGEGEIIIPQAEFIKRAKGKQIIIEEILCQTKPTNKPDRNTILKVFGDFNAAKKYWIWHSITKSYEVKIDENNIKHKGDWNLIQQIYEAPDTETKIKLAKQYWNEKCANDTIIEYFVDKAEVVKVISDCEKERKNTWAAYNNKLLVNPNIRVIKCL